MLSRVQKLSLARSSGCGRRGVTLIYVLVMFAALSGLCSLAVDLGHAEVVKMELTRAVDATAHDYMQLYSTGGQASANSLGPQTYSSTDNPVDDGAGVAPTVSVVWGYWNTTSSTFSATAVTTSVAVRVTMSRTSANGNPVPLLFARALGANGIDITVSAVAALVPGASTNVSVSSLSDPYFAGMPNTTTDSAGDTVATDGATQVTGIPVTPGEYISFSTFTGTSSIVPGTAPYVGPAGQTSAQYGSVTQHGQDWDGSYPYSTGGYSENGIANAIMPEDALMGVFLGANAPNTNTAPATVDWTQPSQLNHTDYNNILLQQPFYVGNGVTSGNVVQKFLVPPGATRLYVGVWDGVQYNNNGGTIAGTIKQDSTIEIVQ
jgi:hypothetical protein